jgi:hypothetical protein
MAAVIVASTTSLPPAIFRRNPRPERDSAHAPPDGNPLLWRRFHSPRKHGDDSMSAASPATSPVRRAAPAAPAFAFAEGGDEIRLNLGDIPLQQESMDIEGFKPTLLSRLFDLVAPLK